MQAWNPGFARNRQFRPAGVGPPAGWSRLDPGVPRVLQVTKSRKVAILATSLVPGHSCPDGRLGPPDSSEKHGKAGKAGKGSKRPFLRVQGPLAKGVSIEAIVVYLARFEQARTGHLAPPGSRTGEIPSNRFAPLSSLDGRKGRQEGSWSLPSSAKGKALPPP